MPLLDLFATSSLNLRTPSMSSSTPFAFTPTVLPCLASSKTSALCRTALVGMHPRSVQVPPTRGSFSTTSVLRPFWPARMAQTYPPGPLPMITRSYVATARLPPARGGAVGSARDLRCQPRRGGSPDSSRETAAIPAQSHCCRPFASEARK